MMRRAVHVSAATLLGVVLATCRGPEDVNRSVGSDQRIAFPTTAMPFASVQLAVQPLVLDTLALLDDSVLAGRSAETFFRVSSGVVDEERTRLFVVNGGWQQVLTYDWEAGELDSFGRRGRGPGEFLRPLWIALLGADSLVVYDRDLAQFSVHSKAGEHHRTFDVPGVGPRGKQAEMIVGTARRRFVLVVSSGIPAMLMDPDSEPRVRARDTLSVLLVDAAGRLADSIVSLENRVWERLPDTMSFSVATVDEAPQPLIASNGEWIVVGNTHSTSVAVLSLAGDTVGALELDRALVEGALPLDGVRLDQFVVGRDGALWVAEATRDEETTKLFRVEPSGRVGSVSVPAGTRLLDADENLLLVRQRDPAGAESVWLLSAKSSN